ncbi:MAG: MATE family efflux transporter, partial [Lachnospiraceae bacterium]|nr:MATE family efflux transporter [Lachnospiraceae bacterium]
MASDKYEINMVDGALFPKILIFYFPLMISGVLQLLFNAADIVVVGRFAGAESLAAVGSTSSLTNLLVNFFIGISIGTNVITASLYGGKRDKELKEIV